MTFQQHTAAVAEQYAQRPTLAQGPIDTRPIDATPDTDEFDAILATNHARNSGTR